MPTPDRPCSSEAIPLRLEWRLLDAMPDMAACFDEHLTCLHANRAFSTHFQVSSSMARGRAIEELCGESQGSRVLAHLIGLALRSGQAQTMECPLDCAGQVEPLAATALPDSGAEERRVVLILRRPASDAATPNTTDRIEQAASGIVPVLRCSTGGRVIDSNQACRKLLAMDLSQAGASWVELVAPHHAGLAAQCAEQLSNQGRFGPVEIDLLTRDAKAVSVICAGSRSEGCEDATLLMVDISDRKYAEQSAAFIAEAGRVLASSLDYGKTLEQVAQLSVPAYADWCFVDIVEDESTLNRVVVAHSEPSYGEVAQGLRRQYPLSRKRVHELRSQLVVDVSDRHLEAGANAHPYLGLLLGLRVKSYMVVPMVARQRLVGFLTFCSAKWNYDGKNQACAEELARRAALCIDNARLYGEAQTASRVREEFLSAASHELKTPLTSLKLQVHALKKMQSKRSELDADELKRRLESIGRQVERQCELVNVLLDVSRIGADRLAIDPEPFDLAVLMRDVTARYDENASDAAAKLRLHAPQELPVTLDRVRVDQVVTNLVSNAIKYGCGRPVDVTLMATDEEIVLVVEDRGIGISDADRARIFERFERAVSLRNYSGFGLGLWITNQIVRAMGGTISLESKVDVGSKFTVRLPQHFEQPTLAWN